MRNNFRPLFSRSRNEFRNFELAESGLNLLQHTVWPQILNILHINEFLQGVSQVLGRYFNLIKS